MSFTTDAIRNVAFAGHGSTGKTALLENLLAAAGVIPKAEASGSGKTVSDYTPEEAEKQISIHTALANVEWEGRKINIMDTPGASDFVGEVVAAFRSSETAVILVDSVSSVQIETIKLWRRLKARKMPKIVFVNKMDKERADYDKVMEDLKTQFPAGNFVPVSFPKGAAAGFEGVIDIVTQKFYAAPGSGVKEKMADLPEDLKGTVEEYRNALIEAAAEGDDELMEKYFEEGTLSDDDLFLGIREALEQEKFVPVFCGAGEKGSGIVSLLNFVALCAPSPLGIAEKAEDKDGNPMEAIIDPALPASLMVYKTSIDQFSGKLSYFKAMSGTIHAESEYINMDTGKKERIGKLFTCQGKKLNEVKEVAAGDFGIINKVDSLQTNVTLADAERLVHYVPLALPKPVHTVAITATAKKEEDKLNQFLHRAAEEDLTFQVHFDPETKETVVSAMGELHLNMILDKIKDKQKVSMETRVPRVAYRETISKKADAEYTHKKQSGGHGQYGRVVMEIFPLDRGEQMSFENAIKGGSISKGYMPGIEKGLIEGMDEGFLAGYPLVDIGFRIVDGKEHPVDSSEMAFKLAAKGALKAAVEKAGPSLLEPIMKIRVFAEETYVGDILSDLSSRRGRVLGQESLGGGITEIDALVPRAETLRYSIDLRSITSGTASFEMEFDHYDPISGKIAEGVIADSKRDEE